MSTVRVLEGLAASHRAVEAVVAGLDERSLALASHRPGWTRSRLVGVLAGVEADDLPHLGADALLDRLRRRNDELETELAGRVGTTATEDAVVRWREVVVLHTDLGVGYDWSHWPADYVRSDLERMTMLWNSRRPMGLTGLPPAALAVPPAQRLAWLLGRADVEGLDAAGVW